MCKELYSVIVTTPTALKVAGIDTWIHYSRVKPTSLTNSWGEWEAPLSLEEPLGLILWRRKQPPWSPARTTLEAGQPTRGWSVRNQLDWQKADVLVINWTGIPPTYLIWNRTLLCVSLWVDYHSKTLPLLCLPLHNSYFLESPPTVISLNMKMAYFCLIVLLSCKIPSSSESQDDCSECMESFYQ